MRLPDCPLPYARLEVDATDVPFEDPPVFWHGEQGYWMGRSPVDSSQVSGSGCTAKHLGRSPLHLLTEFTRNQEGNEMRVRMFKRGRPVSGAELAPWVANGTYTGRLEDAKAYLARNQAIGNEFLLVETGSDGNITNVDTIRIVEPPAHYVAERF